jgi:hypothetical protein
MIGGCGFCTGVFRLRARPDFLHRLDALAHQLEACGERRAVVGHLLGVPAAADAEQQPTVGQPVDGGDLLGGVDGIALDHKADAGAELDGRRDDRGGADGNEGIVGVVVPFRQLGAAGPGRFAAGRDVAVLGKPDRLEAARFRLGGELVRRNRVVGGKHRDADPHGSSSLVVWASVADFQELKVWNLVEEMTLSSVMAGAFLRWQT